MRSGAAAAAEGVLFETRRPDLTRTSFPWLRWDSRHGDCCLTEKVAPEEWVATWRVRHGGRGFSRCAACGIILVLDSGGGFPGRRLGTPYGGVAMTGSSKDSGRYGKLDGSVKEDLFAEGIAMAVAVAVLATVAFFLFRA